MITFNSETRQFSSEKKHVENRYLYLRGEGKTHDQAIKSLKKDHKLSSTILTGVNIGHTGNLLHEVRKDFKRPINERNSKLLTGAAIGTAGLMIPASIYYIHRGNKAIKHVDEKYKGKK